MWIILRKMQIDLYWLLQEDILCVYKRERDQCWQTQCRAFFVSGLRGMKQDCLAGFVATFYIFTMAPRVPEVVSPVQYEQ